MWFTFPPGATSITVEHQLFVSELKDSEGITYFRAPDHFAGKILDLPGFTHKLPPEELNPPADLPSAPAASREADNIRALTGRISALETELSSAKANLATVSMERDELKLKLLELKSTASEASEQDEEIPDAEREASEAAIRDIAAQAAARGRK